MATTVLERPGWAQFLIIIASLVCGAGVWLIVQLTATQEITLIIDVRPDKLADEVEVTLSNDKVPVRFSFPATEAAKMKPTNFAVVLDYSDMKQRVGISLVQRGYSNLNASLVQLVGEEVSGSNITPIEILEPQVEYRARLRSMQGIVKPAVSGAPAEGFVFDPEKAFIDGQRNVTALLTRELEEELRRQRVENIDIPTKPIDITNRHGIVRELTDLLLPPGTSLLPGENPQRLVVIDLPQRTITRTIPKVPLKYEFLYQGEALRAVVDPPAVDVILTGRMTDVNAVTPEMLQFGLFNVVETPGEEREIPVEVRITDPTVRVLVRDIRTEPPTVRVKVLEADGPAPGTPSAEDLDTSPTETPAQP